MTTLKPTRRRTINLSDLESYELKSYDLIDNKIKDKSEMNLDNSEIPSSKEEEKRLMKQRQKYYLPVLKINHPDMWPPIPKSERKHFTDAVAKETCLSNCCGIPGLKSACCRMDPHDLEHVLGPLDEEWILKIVKWFRKKGIHVTRHDIVIDFEEGQIIGRNLFNAHPVFEDPKSYPILRFQVDGPRYACKFLNNQTGMCNIYDVRPNMCRTYLCNYVKSNFLVQLKSSPGEWKALNPWTNDVK